MNNVQIIPVYRGELNILSGQVIPLQEIIGWSFSNNWLVAAKRS